jgi:hypothetical protein
MRTKRTAFSGALLALLLLAGCGSTGGDIFGNNQPTNSPSSNTIRGTVDSVDVNGRSILLTNTNGYSSMLSSGGNGNNGNTVRVYFDNQTNVDYQGRTYRPEDLERGDQVDVRVSQSGNRLVADTVSVIYNAASNTTYPGSNGSYGSTVSGTVTYVDTSRRTITVDTGGRTTVVDYDTNVPVSYGGRSYNVSDLERGDQIDIRTRDLGNGRMVADSVNVIRSISDSGSSSNGTYQNSQNATIRGTVQYVDTSRQTIELAQTSWLNGFAGGTGSGGGNTIVVRYDTSVRVDAMGQLSAVTNLERGDVVDVEVQSANTTTPFARTIRLVRDVRQ